MTDEDIERELEDVALNPPVCAFCGSPCIPAAGHLSVGFMRGIGGWFCPDHPEAPVLVEVG